MSATMDDIEITSLPRNSEAPVADRPEDDVSGAVAVEWQPSGHEKAVIYTLAVINLLVSLDATIIVTALGAIAEDIGGTTSQTFWIGTSYLLVNAVTMPVICSVSDVIGRPICLTFSLAAFTVGTIVCCTANSMASILVGRCIQGVGGGGIHSLSLVIQTDLVPLRFRPKWYGITLGAWAIGLTIGPILGGAIAQKTSWRWIFYLMFPICGFGLVAIPYLLTLRPRAATAREKIGRIDWLGGFCFAGTATAFLIAISWGGTQIMNSTNNHSWGNVSTVAPLVIGALGMILTVFYEMYFAKNPFLRKDLFRDLSSVVSYVAACFQGILLYGLLYYAPFYFMAVKGFTPINTGLALLPNLVAFSIAGIVTGRLVTRFNSFRWAIWGGWVISCFSCAFYIAWRSNDSAPMWVIAFLLGGFSHGAILNAQNFATQALCRPGDEGAAAAMYIFMRQFGMAIGVGIGATTYQNVMKLKLGWEGLPVEIADHAEAYIPTLRAMPPGHERDAIYDAYKFGFQILCSTWLAISFLILILCLVFVKHADMNRKLESEHHLDSERIIRHWGQKKSDVWARD
ncbi:major facilitator superfamily transporter [Hypoxylon rubiginosum]|uniref:Major facilitator superfamily transporter n=1 Tax=Hypoxylon rubiginosum TaxID=110542 RepID=A0ACC0CQK2_9PEZI|nr:major facilitator superfamily transporter [Hypoxylon rubiginosum]